MENKLSRQGEGGDHIWLRYMTQIAANGRTHTVEMSVPLPIGASGEERERLLREAEEGFELLVSHTAQRIPQVIQRALTQNLAATPAPRSVAPPSRSTSPSQAAAQPSISPVAPPQIRETLPEVVRNRGEEATRPSGGLSLPSSPSTSGEGRATMSIPDFIQQIRDNLRLNSNQAMQLLKIRSLSGINLREAYERLVYLVAHDKPAGDVPADNPSSRSVEQRLSALSPDVQALLHKGSSLPTRPTVPPAHEEEEYYVTPTVFDEEVDLDDDEFAEGDDAEGKESEPIAEMHIRGRDVIERLRGTYGTTTASPGRLQVLRNVIDEQISSEQLQELIEGLWSVTVIKKLKVDQLEALISWAKEDDFMSEADVVLQILKEERYAGGNR